MPDGNRTQSLVQPHGHSRDRVGRFMVLGMAVTIDQEPITLDEYARVSIAFEVRSVLEVTERDAGLGGLVLTERSVAAPYVKDYDAAPGEGPSSWPRRFDLSRWVLFAAREEREIVGGAIVAFDTPGIVMLEGRRDLAVLWDIRVAPSLRKRGVGRRLFDAAATWAAARGCLSLKVETQNVNVAACRFYAAQGCVLRAIDRAAYADLPNEAQLLWQKELGRSHG
jgi:GNAT superfamily N-acetyltransferase